MLGTRIILCALVLGMTAANLDQDFLQESSFAADYTVANAVQNFETQTDAEIAAEEDDFLDLQNFETQTDAEIAADEDDFLNFLHESSDPPDAEITADPAPDAEIAADQAPDAEITAGEVDFLDMVGLPEIAAEIDPVLLGRAGDFTILSMSGISSVPSSVVLGDIGVSPIHATAITGFSLTAHASNRFSLSRQVIGQVYAADYATPSPTDMTTAVADMQNAYTSASMRPDSGPFFVNTFQGILAEKVLPSGVYTWDRDISICGNIYLEGTETDVIILKTTGNVVACPGASVFLSGGIRTHNVIWQIAGFLELGTDAHMEGIFLVKTKAVLQTRAGINGRILAQTAVTLDQATVTAPQNVYL
jgi:hypothetical protein